MRKRFLVVVLALLPEVGSAQCISLQYNFNPFVITSGNRSSLSVNLVNSGFAGTLQAPLTVYLPSGLSIPDTSRVFSTCGVGTPTATSSSFTLLANTTIPGSNPVNGHAGACALGVEVTSTLAGAYSGGQLGTFHASCGSAPAGSWTASRPLTVNSVQGATSIQQSLLTSPANSQPSWEQLTTGDLGDIVFANQGGFATFHKGNRALSYLDPMGHVYRTVQYPIAGTGTVYVFPDGWAAEITPQTGISTFDASGALVKSGSFSQILNEPYAPSSLRKWGDVIFAQTAAGLVQLNVRTWVATVLPGGVLPGPDWADSSYRAVRRLAAQPFPTHEEIYVTRTEVSGSVAASYRYPVTKESPFCLMPRYPSSSGQVALSMGDETVILDRLQLTEARRLHFGSCARVDSLTGAVALQVLAQLVPLSVTTHPCSGCTNPTGYRFQYGDYVRINTSPILNQWFWDGSTRIYSAGQDNVTSYYGAYHLDQARVRIVADKIPTDLNAPLSVSLSQYIDGGKAPYSCTLGSGLPSWMRMEGCTIQGQCYAPRKSRSSIPS